MTLETEQRSAAELVRQLSEQASTLVREELTLARMEMVEKGRRAGTGAGLLGAAGILALYGLGALFVTLGAVLALVLPVWAAALAITVLLFAAAGTAALIGKRQVRRALPPEPAMAMASGRRDVAAVRAAIREGRHPS